MKFFCDQCNAQYMIADEKVGPRGVKVKCKKCQHVIMVKPADKTTVDAPNQGAAAAAAAPKADSAPAPRRTEAEISGAFDSLFGNDAPAASPAPGGAFGAATQTPAAAAGEKEWYVAIDDAQVGPVSIGEISQRWDAREVTEDSLAWKAGMPDWVPIADIPELSHLITERPQHKASAGASGATPSARVANAAAPVEWKPSAASALSSLVQEELIAASSPKPAAAANKPEGVPDLGAGFGTNDLFGGKVATSTPDNFAPAPNWSVPSARPHSGNDNKPMYIILGVFGLALCGVVALLALRQPAVVSVPVAVPQPVQPQHTAPTAAAPAAAPTPAAAPAAQPATAQAEKPAADEDEGGDDDHKGAKHHKAKHLRAGGGAAGGGMAAAPTAPPPAAAPAGPVKASLTRDDIWSVVKQNAGRTMPCLKAARSRNEIAPAQYTFIIDWTILPNGSVNGAQLKGPPNVLASSLPGCFSSVISQWHFPASQAGAPIKNFPFGPVNVP